METAMPIGAVVEPLISAPASGTQRTAIRSDAKREISPPELCRVIHHGKYTTDYHPHTGSIEDKEASDAEVVRYVHDRLRYENYQDVPDEKIVKGIRYVEDVQRKRRVETLNQAFSTAVGPRYKDCTVENFQATLPAQQKALARLKDYAEHFAERVEAGANIVAFGASGSGKDHLLCGLARKAIDAGYEVRWQNGRDLFSRFRDSIDKEDESERDLIRPLLEPAVLIISAPLAPSGPLTTYQQDILYRVVDARYRHRKPVWVTLNVKDGAEADERIGVAIVDRLRDGALVLKCDWASHRKPLE